MTTRIVPIRAFTVSTLLLVILFVSARTSADNGMCSGANTSLPFTDVGGSIFFCQIAAAYFSGLTNGTSATTFSPSAAVTREQMAAFTTRTLDQSLTRGSRRAVAQQWWQPTTIEALPTTSLPTGGAYGIAWDGADLWVAGSSQVFRVRASDGRLLETWSGADSAWAILVAAGRVFVTASVDPEFPGQVYSLDPRQTPGAVTTIAITPPAPVALTFDGQFLWTANAGTTFGSITRIPLTGGPGTTFDVGLGRPFDILWDGENLWVVDYPGEQLKRETRPTERCCSLLQWGSALQTCCLTA